MNRSPRVFHGRCAHRPRGLIRRPATGWNGRCACAHRPFAYALLAALLLIATPAAAAPDRPGYRLGALREMAAAGAPGLALQRLDEAQPDAASVPDIWARWERARIAILVQAGATRRALDRLGKLPPAAPESFRRWALTRRSALHLDLGEVGPSRRLARELLWTAGAGASEGELRTWRRLVVRGYLVGDRIDDAVTALRRFDQDYRAPAPDWDLLRARVLLRAGRPREAARRLSTDTIGERHALYLLAGMRGEMLAPAAVARRAREAARHDGISAPDAARFWFVAAEAAGREGVPGQRALATEQAAVLAGALPRSDTVFRLDGDALWSAWVDRGLAYGNDHQLLIGDNDAWFGAAAQALPKHPVLARSLLAVVALRGEGDAAVQAHRRLLDLLADDPGLVVARRAYLHGGRFPTLDDVPEIVRYRLVDDALQRDDLGLATRLLARLPEAPGDVSEYAWRLLRARVLVLGGHRDEGVEALDELLDDYPELGDKALDRFLQVVFDLQGAQAHDVALRLLRRIGERDLPGQRRRELLYWRADSRDALGDYRRAAELYLRSATLVDGVGNDPWGRTARYQAAGMLAEAGLVGDARRIYRQLLQITRSSDRRATLRQRLQKLGLHEAAPDNLPLPDDAE